MVWWQLAWMSEIVNLRRVKRARARQDAAAEAEAARRLHGRTRAERDAAEAARAQADRVLDGAKLDQPGTANRAKDTASTS